MTGATLEADPLTAAVQPKIRAYYYPNQLEHAGAAGGWIDALGYPFCKGRIFEHTETDEGQYDTAPHDLATECFWATGAAMAVRADRFLALGGFDGEYFAHMEEIDWCWRAKRAGFRIRVDTRAVVWHVGGGTLNTGSPQKTYLNFRNSLVTLIKNESATRLIWQIPARLILDGVAGARFLTNGSPAECWAIVRAHWSVFPALSRFAF